MKLNVALLLAGIVGGCLPDQAAKNMASCRVEADRFYQGYNNVEVNNPRSQYIIACMATKGYNFDISSSDCESQHPLPTQVSCYVAKSWLARITDEVRDTHQ